MTYFWLFLWKWKRNRKWFEEEKKIELLCAHFRFLSFRWRRRRMPNRNLSLSLEWIVAQRGWTARMRGRPKGREDSRERGKGRWKKRPFFDPCSGFANCWLKKSGIFRFIFRVPKLLSEKRYFTIPVQGWKSSALFYPFQGSQFVEVNVFFLFLLAVHWHIYSPLLWQPCLFLLLLERLIQHQL